MAEETDEKSDSNEQQTAFVIMPFSLRDVDKERYKEDKDHWFEVYEGLIQPAVEKAGLRCTRDDDDPGQRLGSEGIFRKIENADLIIADLSSHNPNVFLELGWALRADRPFVLIKDELTGFNFDLNQQITFKYAHGLRPRSLKKEITDLAEKISKTLSDDEHRFSYVRKLGVDLARIEAASSGDVESGLLLEIRDLLKREQKSKMVVPEINRLSNRAPQFSFIAEHNDNDEPSFQGFVERLKVSYSSVSVDRLDNNLFSILVEDIKNVDKVFVISTAKFFGIRTFSDN